MGRKVLIIDDERDLCLIMGNHLKKKNNEVFFAPTLSEGLKVLEAWRPDVLLLDNNLPDALGWREVNNIHAAHPSMKITLISALDASPFAITTDGAGYTKLEKPVSLKALDAILEN